MCRRAARVVSTSTARRASSHWARFGVRRLRQSDGSPVGEPDANIHTSGSMSRRRKRSDGPIEAPTRWRKPSSRLLPVSCRHRVVSRLYRQSSGEVRLRVRLCRLIGRRLVSLGGAIARLTPDRTTKCSGFVPEWPCASQARSSSSCCRGTVPFGVRGRAAARTRSHVDGARFGLAAVAALALLPRRWLSRGRPAKGRARP
jgi:hypothetical protein